MKVELEKTFPMPAAAELSWAFLQNVAGVAGCMPGAKITERIDDTHYKGTISVKVGPAGMSFKGEIEVRELDSATRTLHLVGKGSDTSGSSGASMDLVARIEPGTDAGTSNLVGRSEVTMSGKAAAFGGRMMGTVADQILKQFAGNFATQVQALAASSASANNVAASGGPAPVAGANSTALSGGPASVAGANSTTASGGPASVAGANSTTASGGPASVAGANSTTASGGPASANASPPLGSAVPSAAAASSHPAPVAAPSASNELNALALFWAILRDWFRGLFRRKPA